MLFYIFLINGGTGDVQGKFSKKGGEEDDFNKYKKMVVI